MVTGLRRSSLVLSAALLAACTSAQAGATASRRASPAPTTSHGVIVAAPSPGLTSTPPPPSPEAPAAPVRFDGIAFRTPTVGWAVGLRAAGDNTATVEISHSLDGGTTWSRAIPVATYAHLDVAYGSPSVRFADARHGFVFGQGAVETLDGGTTWNDAGLAGRVYEIAPVGADVWAAVGCDPTVVCRNQILTRSLGGGAWNGLPAEPDLSSSPISLLRVSHDVAVAAVVAWQDKPRLAVTNDAGRSWRALQGPCSNLGQGAIASDDGRTIWLACGGQPGAGEQPKALYVSTNGGTSWELRARDYPDPVLGDLTIGGYVNALRISASGVGFLGLAREGILRSTDGGRTWKDLGVSDGAGGDAHNLWLVDSSHLWAVVAGINGPTLYRSTDGGATWSAVASSPPS